jgi:hypothetical protein
MTDPVFELIMKCPATGQWVKTGLAMNRGTFEAAQFSGNSSSCSACGKSHRWEKESLRLG